MWSAQTYERVESAAKVIKSGPPKLIESTHEFPRGYSNCDQSGFWMILVMGQEVIKRHPFTSIPGLCNQCNFRTRFQETMTNATRGAMEGRMD